MSSFTGISNATGLYQLINGAPLVTSSLMLHLDASNVTSYPGTGVTWTDISGNGKVVTLTDGPTYNAANGVHLF
jgi:hypothetical protein